MTKSASRRKFLKSTALGLAFGPSLHGGTAPALGGVIGEPQAAGAGNRVLAEGGNVVDAIVTAAATAAITSPQMCGFGGYGGQLILALQGGARVTSIEFNTVAPLAATPDMFFREGKPNPQLHQFGWLSVGVPGLPAGLDLAMRRYGTIGLGKALEPALRFCKEGFPVSGAVATAFANNARLRKDPASEKLFYSEGKAPVRDQLLKNPRLAEVLEEIARANSSEPFYHGTIAKKLCEEAARGGGLLSEKDMANYKARENEAVRWACQGFEVCTSPLTSGGVTALQALAIQAELNQLDWTAREKFLGRVEAMRLVWRDRLRLMGDPDQVSNPTKKLLSKDACQEAAREIASAIKTGKPLKPSAKTTTQTGTINLSAVDGKGNLAALTLTHGGSFGAQVSASSLGLVMSHGLSRFNIEPGHPNSVAPGKRPLHNMCPTIILKDGKNHAALGGRGGRKIPNAVFEVIFQMVMGGKGLKEAVASPRIHTEGNLDVELEAGFGAEKLGWIKNFGLKGSHAASATISAVSVGQGISSPILAMR